MPISVPENRTQGAAISGVSRIIKLPVAYAFSVILRVAQGGAAYSPVLKCTIIVKNSIPPRLTFFLSVSTSRSTPHHRLNHTRQVLPAAIYSCYKQVMQLEQPDEAQSVASVDSEELPEQTLRVCRLALCRLHR